MGTPVKVWRAYFPRWSRDNNKLIVECLDGIETPKRIVVKDGSFNQHVLPDSIHRTEESALDALEARLADDIDKMQAELAEAQRHQQIVAEYRAGKGA